MNTLAAVHRAAARQNLRWLIIGGHAVIAHGYSRNTFDIDIAVRRSDRAAWLALAKELGFEFQNEGATFLQFNSKGGAGLALDMMLVNDPTFAQLEAQAVPAPLATEGAQVVSLRHLLAMKCHAVKHGHQGRIVKDANDVIMLVQANRLSLVDPEWRNLFLKYGTLDFYEKVRTACAEG